MNNDDLWNTWKLLLVGGIPTPLKNMSSSNGIIIPNIWENKKWSKPPTRLGIMMIYESSSKKNGDWFVTDRKKIRRHIFFCALKICRINTSQFTYPLSWKYVAFGGKMTSFVDQTHIFWRVKKKHVAGTSTITTQRSEGWRFAWCLTTKGRGSTTRGVLPTTSWLIPTRGLLSGTSWKLNWQVWSRGREVLAHEIQSSR
jgi:hypothetical protein